MIYFYSFGLGMDVFSNYNPNFLFNTKKIP